jgi:hypothetical protein
VARHEIKLFSSSKMARNQQGGGTKFVGAASAASHLSMSGKSSAYPGSQANSSARTMAKDNLMLTPSQA